MNKEGIIWYSWISSVSFNDKSCLQQFSFLLMQQCMKSSWYFFLTEIGSLLCQSQCVTWTYPYFVKNTTKEQTFEYICIITRMFFSYKCTKIWLSPTVFTLCLKRECCKQCHRNLLNLCFLNSNHYYYQHLNESLSTRLII